MQVISVSERPSYPQRDLFYIPLEYSPYLDAHIMQWVEQMIQEISENSDLIHQVYEGIVSEKAVEEEFDQLISGRTFPSYLSIKLLKQIFMEKLFGYGILQFLIDDSEVTDIFVNDHETILKRTNGKDIPVKIRFRDEQHVEEYLRTILMRVNANINRYEPIVDSRDIKYHLRINGAIQPVVKKPYFTIRKHQRESFTMQDLIRLGTLSPELAKDLQMYIESGMNILISGPTGSGKTTLLRGLTEYIHPLERIVVIEEEEELQIWHRNMVAMEAKHKKGDDEAEIIMDDLVRNAMRMSPKRIILGELRGKEALNLIRAFGTGHDGGMTTIHANNVSSALKQLAFLMLYAETPLKLEHFLSMIADTVDVVIHIVQQRVVDVAEVMGYDRQSGQILTRSLWKWQAEQNPEKYRYIRKQPSPSFVEKINFRKAIHQRGMN